MVGGAWLLISRLHAQMAKPQHSRKEIKQVDRILIHCVPSGPANNAFLMPWWVTTLCNRDVLQCPMLRRTACHLPCSSTIHFSGTLPCY